MLKKTTLWFALFILGIFFLEGVQANHSTNDPTAQNLTAQNLTVQKRLPKNVILFIGDGMGPSHIKAFRHFKDNPATATIEPLLLDSMLLGSLATDPDQKAGDVTDSAASATAYSAGIKTLNSSLAVDKEGKAVSTVLEVAKQNGRKTGLVATSEITHATPAAFVSHVTNRREKNTIANFFVDNQYENKPVVDVFLGGGWKYFKRDDRDLITELEKLDYDVIQEKSELAKTSGRVAGLFADDGLPGVKDREEKHPSLKEMTETAIRLLNNDKGFFLMVEGSQIDWASHANDVTAMLHEMDDFNAAIESAMTFAKTDGDTLILVTADHETGGLSIGAKHNGESLYQFNTDAIKQIPKSVRSHVKDFFEGRPLTDVLLDMKLEATDDEITEAKTFTKESEPRDVYFFVLRVIDRVSNTGWTTNGHTGVDVNLYGYGPSADGYRGHHQNTKVGQMLLYWAKRTN